jgi:hypothetical protein
LLHHAKNDWYFTQVSKEDITYFGKLHSRDFRHRIEFKEEYQDDANDYGIETMKVNNTSTTILIVATGLLHKYRREDDLSHSNAYDSIS